MTTMKTQSTTEATRAVVAGYVAALQRGDLDALLASFAPDATWWLRGDLPTSGTWTGPSEILEGFLAAMTARLDVSQPLTITYETQRSDVWGTLVKKVDRERSLIRSRAASKPETLPNCCLA